MRKFRYLAAFALVFLTCAKTVAAEEQLVVEEVEDVYEGIYDGGEPSELHRKWSISYLNIFYGPALKNTTSYQPTPTGEKDLDRPVFLKNFATLGYEASEDLTLAGTVYWTWKPVRGQEVILRDPSLRIGYDGLIRSDTWNLYGDLRVHFPVTSLSREADLLAAFQTFQILTYQVGTSRLSLNTYSSVRANFFGRQGYGNDLELYFGPNLSYQLSRTVAFTFLYEINVSHVYGAKPYVFSHDGSDLEPGIGWDVTPNLFINPYLHFYPGGTIGLQSTSLGMIMSWKLL